MARHTEVSTIAEAIQALQDIRITKWTAVAAQVLFVYDLLLTLSDEYRYVWKAKWTMGKALYLLVRYPFNIVLLTVTVFLTIAPGSAITSSLCASSAYWEAFGGWVQVAAVQVILGLRVAALYGMRRDIVWIIGGLGCITSAALLGLNVLIIRRTSEGVPLLPPEFIACWRNCPGCPSILRFVYLPLIVFDTTVFCLLFYKHCKHSKHHGGLGTPLFWMLYRDGFLCFTAIFALLTVNLLIFNIARPSLFEVMVPFSRCIMGILCGRLLLNLRGVLLQQPFEAQQTKAVPNIDTSSPYYRQTQASAGVGVWNAGGNSCFSGTEDSTLSYVDQKLPPTHSSEEEIVSMFGHDTGTIEAGPPTNSPSSSRAYNISPTQSAC